MLHWKKNFRLKFERTDLPLITYRYPLMTTIDKINLITEKVQQLLSRQQLLLKENQEIKAGLEQDRSLLRQLQEENSLLQSKLDAALKELERRSFVEVELKIKVSELEAQTENLRNSSGTLDESSRKAMEKQINHYIREIDRCIALLSQ